MPYDFQSRVAPWMLECFGADIAADAQERNHRFLEEALELVQACGCTRTEAYQLVDYVFGRPIGESEQETGGVMLTLAALCLAHKLDMHAAAETELARVWQNIAKIRAKQAAKPKHSPLPEAPSRADAFFAGRDIGDGNKAPAVEPEISPEMAIFIRTMSKSFDIGRDYSSTTFTYRFASSRTHWAWEGWQACAKLKSDDANRYRGIVHSNFRDAAGFEYGCVKVKFKNGAVESCLWIDDSEIDAILAVQGGAQ